MAKNYYEILGIKKGASADEIKSSYRKLAKQYHPDMFTNASDAEKKEAEVKFKEVNHAYEVLSDDQKRKIYDTYGDENGPQPGQGFGAGAAGFGFDVDDIFSTIFNGFG
ncbi:MAG: DnaJ domain-containing protein, partial [[Eubacterium] siraeum]|nr:DnaJ domain-containing protein [[Eubacterium] siraeum]